MLVMRVAFMVVALGVFFATSVRAQTTTSTTDASTTTTTLLQTWLKCYKAADSIKVSGGSSTDWLHLDNKACKIGGAFRLVCVPVGASVDANKVTSPLPIGGGPFVPTVFPDEQVLAQDRICYKLRCNEAAPTIPGGTQFADVFGGPRTLTAAKAYLVCAPAEGSKCGNGVLDFGEDCDDGNKTSGDCCSSTCKFEAATQTCGSDDDTTDCFRPSCDGAGHCLQPGTVPEAAGHVCGTDTDGDLICTKPRCDGAGNCSQTGFLAAAGTTCLNQNDPGCTVAQCDGNGACVQDAIVRADGFACTNNTDSNPCTTGQCVNQVCDPTIPVAQGVACPPTDSDLCTSAACDGNRNCVDDFFVRNCTDPQVCNPLTGNCE